ncbi:MAG TPA: DinB family protein [Fimbriimonas sp.]|nr:DinB family protein [Fimbriimonas sp.]
MESTAQQAQTCIDNLNQESQRMLKLLSFVPDDKLNWAPSSSARTALQLVAHCAVTNPVFQAVITSNLPDPCPEPGEFFALLKEQELAVTTREQAIELLTKSTADLSSAMSAVDDAQMATSPNSPFGPLPMGFWLGVTHAHFAGHNGQLEYLQTIWGDLDNHMG